MQTPFLSLVIMETNLIQFQNFILATRDSGYKSTASALAELVDNAIEATASRIEIKVIRTEANGSEQYEVLVIDNGCGMTADELSLALQFGGSSRFNSRTNLGRYGMGLPNSSLSQCRRVEVISWKTKEKVFYNHLDIDEIVEKELTKLPKPKQLKKGSSLIASKSGTVVHWKRCDRLSFKYLKNLTKHIQIELGKVFRWAIWRGVEIFVCGEKVVAFDPLFVGDGWNLKGGISFGKELSYLVKVPGNEKKLSEIKVRFVELPVQVWAKLPNEEKRRNQITKCAGVSILRAEREIDYGWFFMGEKRKENYDDWWRCEISFKPDLDEIFGVTHTKQEIKETEFANNILIPDIEQIARTLNNRVRLKFIELKKASPNVYAKKILESSDGYLPGLDVQKKKTPQFSSPKKLKGFEYSILTKKLNSNVFFEVEEKANQLLLIINSNHIFYSKIFKALHDRKVVKQSEIIKFLEIIVFAAGRSEFLFNKRAEEAILKRFKDEWSSNIKTFLS